MSSTAARRTERLIVRRVDDETVVYDLDNEQVTCLDARTAAVWSAVDGRVSLAHVARKLDLSHNDVAIALVRLDEAGLMQAVGGMSRRTVLKGLGVGAAVVPLLTVMAPPAAAACSVAQTTTVTGFQAGCANNKEKISFTVTGFNSGAPVTVTVYDATTNLAITTTSGGATTPVSDCASTTGTLQVNVTANTTVYLVATQTGRPQARSENFTLTNCT